MHAIEAVTLLSLVRPLSALSGSNPGSCLSTEGVELSEGRTVHP